MKIAHDLKRQPLVNLDITPEQSRKMQTAIAFLLVHQSFFSDLMMRKLPIVYSRLVPIAATDHYSIIINPDTFFDDKVMKSHKERAFVLAHEVLHYVFNDCIMIFNWGKSETIHINGTDYPWINEIMQHAMDYRSNALLKLVEKLAMPEGCLYDPQISKEGMESCTDLYEKIYKKAEKEGRIKKDGKGQPGQGGPGEGDGDGQYTPGKGEGKPFDKVLPPGTSQGEAPSKAAGKASDADRQVAVAAAAQAAEMMGNLPAGLKRLVGSVLDPKVAWQDIIRTTINRTFGQDGYDWSNADKRMMTRPDPMFFARSSSFGSGTIAIGVDTSGSITNDMVDRFFGEMGGIIADLNPAKFIVIWCDAKVDRVDILDEPTDLVDLKQLIDNEGFGGGGGTDFRPVFKEIDELGLEVDGLVFFTDLYGSFPDRAPEYPVIWASINNGKGPWGETVHVEL
jgi:predicted metal-dependent peptidase